MPYEAVIFDFDYTLADATPGIVGCVNHALGVLGLADRPEEDIRRTVGMTLEDLVRYAGEVGLDRERMRAALVDRRHAETVDEDIELATELGVSGTPTTFVEGEEVSGAVPYAELEEAVKAVLEER